MDKRVFKANKLYRVVMIIVIMLTTILAIKWIYFDNMGVIDQRISNDYQSCDAIYRISSVEWGNCYKVAQEKYAKLISQLNQDPLWVLGLPVLFFGGTWVYKYVFPAKKSFQNHT